MALKVILLAILLTNLVLWQAVTMFAAEKNINFNLLDTDPPKILSSGPIGTLLSGTSRAELSVKTNEWAECRYIEGGGADFFEMKGPMATSSGSTLHTATVDGLETGSGYIFSVKCSDIFGNINLNDARISFIVAAPVSGGDFARPAAPPNLSVLEEKKGGVTISWDESYDNSKIIKYNVYRCGGIGCTPNRIIASTAETSFTDTGLQDFFPYSYEISAVDDSLNESPRSKKVFATTTSSAYLNEEIKLKKNTAGDTKIGQSVMPKQAVNMEQKELKQKLIAQLKALIEQLSELIRLFMSLNAL